MCADLRPDLPGRPGSQGRLPLCGHQLHQPHPPQCGAQHPEAPDNVRSTSSSHHVPTPHRGILRTHQASSRFHQRMALLLSPGPEMHERGHSVKGLLYLQSTQAARPSNPVCSCGPCDRESLSCRYYYQVGDGTTFSTTYNFTTFADVSKGAWLSVCISATTALPHRQHCLRSHALMST